MRTDSTLRRILDDVSALPRTEAVRLDNKGGLLRPYVSQGVLVVVEDLEGRRGHRTVPHELLREDLACFDGGAPRNRTEYGDTLRLEGVDDPPRKGVLRTDDNEVDLHPLREFEKPGRISHINVMAFGYVRDAAVTGNAVKLVDARRRGELPAQRVLSPT